jgi:hypothetical protein
MNGRYHRACIAHKNDLCSRFDALRHAHLGFAARSDALHHDAEAAEKLRRSGR